MNRRSFIKNVTASLGILVAVFGTPLSVVSCVSQPKEVVYKLYRHHSLLDQFPFVKTCPYVPDEINLVVVKYSDGSFDIKDDAFKDIFNSTSHSVESLESLNTECEKSALKFRIGLDLAQNKDIGPLPLP